MKILLRPMNVGLGTQKDLSHENYIFEPKLDGYRALCFANKKLEFISRGGIDITKKYPELSFRSKIKARSCVLDGEIIAYDEDGKPSFDALQKGEPATFVVFDILLKDGKDLMRLPLEKRKKILRNTVKNGKGLEEMVFSSNGPALWQAIQQQSLEGVVAKDTASYYYPGIRSRHWLKIKIHNTIDCVIVGYKEGKRKISSLALALYDTDKQLHYIGNVGTGFSENSIRLLLKRFRRFKTIKNPCVEPIPPKNMTFLLPQLVCEVRFAQFTAQRNIRQCSFMRLRDDKKARDCTFKDQVLPVKSSKK